MSEAFRERITQPVESEPKKAPEVEGIVESDLDIFTESSNNLDDWEITNGKYGLDYMGIKEIGKTFPLNAQFGIIDKFIKSEIEERGYDKTTSKWQEILKEIEDEIGSSRLNSYERLKKISSFVNILKKQKELKKKKELYIQLK